MAVEPQVQQFIDFIRDEMPRRIKTNPNSLPDAEKLLVSVSGTLDVIYKTLAELDIAKKSDVDSELSNKEPSITAGSDTQYWRGDKTFQTLDAAAVAETVTRVYLSPEQKTVATQAASTSTNGYLTSTDWDTFNSKLGLADVRYQFVSNPDSTYTVPASAVTAAGRTIIELSNNSLTSITINTATGTGKTSGDSVNISITGTYAAQALVGSGVTLEGDLTFSYQYQTKTLIYKGSNTWKVVG